MHTLHIAFAVGLIVVLCSCGGTPAPRCIDSGLSFLDGSDEIPSDWCKQVQILLVAQSNDPNCRPKETFRYIDENAEYIIDHSVFAGFPDDDKKEQINKWQKSARAAVKKCQFK